MSLILLHSIRDAGRGAAQLEPAHKGGCAAVLQERACPHCPQRSPSSLQRLPDCQCTGMVRLPSETFSPSDPWELVVDTRYSLFADSGRFRPACLDKNAGHRRPLGRLEQERPAAASVKAARAGLSTEKAATQSKIVYLWDCQTDRAST